MTEKEQAWEDMNGPHPKCDACGREIEVGENDRPWQYPEMSRAGYMHVVCRDCAGWLDRGRMVRLLNRVLLRSL